VEDIGTDSTKQVIVGVGAPSTEITLYHSEGFELARNGFPMAIHAWRPAAADHGRNTHAE